MRLKNKKGFVDPVGIAVITFCAGLLLHGALTPKVPKVDRNNASWSEEQKTGKHHKWGMGRI